MFLVMFSLCSLETYRNSRYWFELKSTRKLKGGCKFYLMKVMDYIYNKSGESLICSLPRKKKSLTCYIANIYAEFDIFNEYVIFLTVYLLDCNLN